MINQRLPCYHALTLPAIILCPNGEEALLMIEEDMRARMRRLAKLAQGLGIEASLWKKCDAPVLYVHRLEYIEGIQDAVSGLE